MTGPDPWQPIVPRAGWTDPMHRHAYRTAYEHGYRRLVDSEPVRQHLTALVERDDIGLDTLVTALHLNRATLTSILRCKRRKVYRETAEAILAFRPQDADGVANGVLIDATATRLRVQALQALGYTERWIAASIGRCTNSGILLGPRVRRDKALEVLGLCRRLGSEPGPSQRARTRARNHHWRPPAGYGPEFYSEHWRP